MPERGCRHCEERSDEAIQSFARLLDCFACARNDGGVTATESSCGIPDRSVAARPIVGKTHVVRKDDFIFLSPGVEHAISNSGLVDLVFLVITSPVTDDEKPA
jgi:hypothetical protein